jgi:hypothetical protein
MNALINKDAMAEQGLEYLLANSPFGGLEDMISGNYI